MNDSSHSSFISIFLKLCKDYKSNILLREATKYRSNEKNKTNAPLIHMYIKIFISKPNNNISMSMKDMDNANTH